MLATCAPIGSISCSCDNCSCEIAAVALVQPLPRPSVGRGMHPRVVKAGIPTLARQQQHRSSKHSDPDKRHAAKNKQLSRAENQVINQVIR